MMRNLVCALFLALLSTTSYGQSLKIAQSMTDTLVRGPVASTTYLRAFLSVTNISAYPIGVLMKYDIDSPAYLTDSLWFAFYGMWITNAHRYAPPSLVYVLQPGDSIPNHSTAIFEVYADGNGQVLSENVKVTFFNFNDTNDYVTQNVTFELYDDLSASENNSPVFRLYPNPARDILQVKNLPPSPGLFYVTIYDATGSLVYHQNYDYQQVMRLDLRNLSPGCYSISIRGSQGFLGRSKFIRK